MERIINEIYVYCTDLIINLANILNLSYYEINAIIFLFIYPLVIVGLIVIYLFQKRRLNKIISGFESY
tara:strand:- start:313 stop:516 length:204 start_codon:yes stop_codon:yes gene_type:complete